MRSAQSRREANHTPGKQRSKDVGEAQQTRSSEQRLGLIREAKGKTVEAANVPVWLVQRSKTRIQKKKKKKDLGARGTKQSIRTAKQMREESSRRLVKRKRKKDACPEMGLSHSLSASAS